MKKLMGYLVNNKTILIASTLLITLIILPIGFNFLFLWESGFAKGTTSDWFVLFGGIFGGLIGGLFTYLALVLTIKNQKEEKAKELKPRLDIPHQSIDFMDGEGMNKVVIELNNIGGTIAKNIECKLSLLNFEKVIETIEKNKQKLKVDVLKNEIDKCNVSLIHKIENGRRNSSLGSVKQSYNSVFIGSCIPLVLNHNSKVNYLLEHNVNSWVDYIVKNRNYTALLTNNEVFDNELFKLKLEVSYSSPVFDKITDVFILEWSFIGIWGDSNGKLKYQYVLKSKLEI